MIIASSIYAAIFVASYVLARFRGARWTWADSLVIVWGVSYVVGCIFFFMMAIRIAGGSGSSDSRLGVVMLGILPPGMITAAVVYRAYQRSEVAVYIVTASFIASFAGGLLPAISMVVSPAIWHLIVIYALVRFRPLKLSDPNLCPACNYELRGLSQPKCPECGAAVVLPASSY